MRATRTLVALLFFILAAPASAQRAAPAPYVFAVSSSAPGPVRELVGEEVIGAPRPGRYFVFDLQGLGAEARVFRSRRLDNAMVSGGVPPHQYELSIVRSFRGLLHPPATDAVHHLVAIGGRARRARGSRPRASTGPSRRRSTEPRAQS